MQPSIRRRLLLTLALGLVTLITASGFVLAATTRVRLTAEFDAALVTKAQAFVAFTEQEDGQIELDYRPELMPEFQRAEKPEHFQFWLDDGSVLLRSSRLQGDLPRAPGLDPGPLLSDVALPDGRSGRSVQVAYVPGRAPASANDEDSTAASGAAASGPRAQRSILLVVARGRESLDATLGALRLTILLVAGATALLAALLVWRALARGLAPLEQIAAQVERLGTERPGARVLLAQPPRELAGVTLQINGLLDRLEQAMARERRFTGNVAHELRTPIAELRSLAAVGARWPDDAENNARFFTDCQAIAGRMEGLVTDLLLLARCQAGQEPVALAPVVLAEAARAAWAGLAPRAAEARLRMRMSVPEDLLLTSDALKLGMLLRNLLDNAVSYAPAGAEIRCTAWREPDGTFELEIANPAERLLPGQLTRLAEPFWRADEARASADHAGLGLALVSALAPLIGLKVRLAQDEANIFRARLSGPATPPGRPAAEPRQEANRPPELVLSRPSASRG